MNMMPNNIVQPPAQPRVLSIDVLPRSETKFGLKCWPSNERDRSRQNSENFVYRMGTAQIYGAQVNTGRARLQSGRKKPRRRRYHSASPRLCRCLFFFKPAPKHHRTTNPALDTTTPSQQG